MTESRSQKAWALASFGLALLSLVAMCAFAAEMSGALDPPGTLPLALDFDSFWSAAMIALHQGARAVYAEPVVDAFQRAHTAMPAAGTLVFYYPPNFLLLCLPLALLPYAASLLVFESVQAALLLPALKRIAGRGWSWLAVLACPGFVMNVFSGQNGGLSAACLAFALLSLDRRPWLGGACLGLLSCKPQLAACVPVALLAARRWRAAVAAGAMAAVLIGLATWVLGLGAWQGFLANAPAARASIETIAIKWPMMQSLYAGIRLAGFSVRAGYAGQLCLALAALALLIRICLRRPGAGPEIAALAAAALLVTPYFYDYDLVLLSVPIAWLAGDASRHGWAKGEKPLLLLCYLAPFGARAIGMRFGIAIAPPLILWLLLAIHRRVVTA
jgi:hypothetical protein